MKKHTTPYHTFVQTCNLQNGMIRLSVNFSVLNYINNVSHIVSMDITETVKKLIYTKHCSSILPHYIVQK